MVPRVGLDVFGKSRPQEDSIRWPAAVTIPTELTRYTHQQHCLTNRYLDKSSKEMIKNTCIRNIFLVIFHQILILLCPFKL